MAKLNSPVIKSKKPGNSCIALKRFASLSLRRQDNVNKRQARSNVTMLTNRYAENRKETLTKPSKENKAQSRNRCRLSKPLTQNNADKNGTKTPRTKPNYC